jgi:hypothetical protein
MRFLGPVDTHVLLKLGVTDETRRTQLTLVGLEVLVVVLDMFGVVLPAKKRILILFKSKFCLKLTF